MTKLYKTNQDYSVCIKVSEDIYQTWQSRLEHKGIKVSGAYSKISKANRLLVETAMQSLTEDDLVKIIDAIQQKN